MTGKRNVPPLDVPDPLVVAETGESPTVQVRVWRGDDLIHRQLCETAEEAAAVVDSWSEVEGVRCEVDDLAVRHRPDQILDPAPSEGYLDPDVARPGREGPA